MKEPDDNGTLDAELKPYLDGRDGVSAAWRNASAEQPPAGLDVVILNAARAAVQQRTPPVNRAGHGNYRIAASFMVGVLVTSLYFNAPDDVERETVSTASSRMDEIAGAEALPAEAPQATRAAIEQNVTVAFRDVAVEAIPTPVISTTLPPPPPARAAQEAAPAPQADLVVTDFVAARAELQQAGVEQLEEITVTGSRIAEAARPDNYRATRQDWLAYILTLGEQVTFLVDELGTETSNLEEEMRLFSEAYPDVDLEAALEGRAEE